MFLVPRSDYTIDDNWYVTGLCGTGSKDIVVEGAFVPEYRTHSYLDAFHLRNPGAAVNDGPLYRLPFGAVFPNSIAAPAIGVALGALDAFREQSRVRVNLRDGSRLSEDPFSPSSAFACESGRRNRPGASRRRMRDNMRSGNDGPGPRRQGDPADRACAATAGSGQGRRLERARVDRLMEASGGRGIFPTNPIQRLARCPRACAPISAMQS
jgi:3-hydroxy-9,10-secoandrosta-1,3,5(10)-triene-9,17-dione monooxygenase